MIRLQLNLGNQEDKNERVNRALVFNATASTTANLPLEFRTTLGFLIPDTVEIGCLDWLVTPHLMRCRPQHASAFQRVFVTLVRGALTKMHHHGVAHQDVRFANICFYSASNTARDLVAVFIDLDRTEVAGANFERKFVGEMYEPPPAGRNKSAPNMKWTYAHQDVKQLAMLGLLHHQPALKDQECHCSGCEELRKVKESGEFPTQGSVFTQNAPDFIARLTSFYQALCCDNQFTVT
jgi:hypothetical protein